MSEEELVTYTVKQVATQLQVNEKTVRGWIRLTEGALPAFPVGGRGYRILKKDLDAFVENRKRAFQEGK